MVHVQIGQHIRAVYINPIRHHRPLLAGGVRPGRQGGQNGGVFHEEVRPCAGCSKRPLEPRLPLQPGQAEGITGKIV